MTSESTPDEGVTVNLGTDRPDKTVEMLLSEGSWSVTYPASEWGEIPPVEATLALEDWLIGAFGLPSEVETEKDFDRSVENKEWVSIDEWCDNPVVGRRESASIGKFDVAWDDDNRTWIVDADESDDVEVYV